MNIAIGAVLGLLAWALAQAIALGMTGAGHGWVGPFFYSGFLVVLYPLVFIRALGSWRGPIWVDIGVLLVGAVLSVLILNNILVGERRYFLMLWRDAPEFVAIWLGLCVLWLVIALIPLLSGAKRAR